MDLYIIPVVLMMGLMFVVNSCSKEDLIGGVLTKVTVAGNVGDGCYFVVEDNGEGKKPGTLGPDRISALFYAPGVGCADAVSFLS